MESKTEKAVRFYKQMELRKAFAIFKTFKRQFTKQEKRAIEIAAECFSGNYAFYKQLGIDTDLEISIAEKAINDKIINHQK